MDCIKLLLLGLLSLRFAHLSELKQQTQHWVTEVCQRINHYFPTSSLWAFHVGLSPVPSLATSLSFPPLPLTASGTLGWAVISSSPCSCLTNLKIPYRNKEFLTGTSKGLKIEAAFFPSQCCCCHFLEANSLSFELIFGMGESKKLRVVRVRVVWFVCSWTWWSLRSLPSWAILRFYDCVKLMLACYIHLWRTLKSLNHLSTEHLNYVHASSLGINYM